MAKIENCRDIVQWRLCTGCGVCLAACTKGAVRLRNIEGIGIRPYFNEEACRGCVDCLSSCPGYLVDRNMAAGFSRPLSTAEQEYGPVLELWEGYATDPQIRHRASSGGLLSAIALYCLEQENMEFVLHTAMDQEKPWLNTTVKSKTREAIIERTGSRYAPASPGEGLGEIEKSHGPCVFIGKPCDAAGTFLLRNQRPELDARLGLVLTFCCAGTPSTRGTLNLIHSLCAEAGQIEKVSYRGEGWPGRFKVVFDGGAREESLPYAEAWTQLTKSVPFRCRICPHGLGELSDIACGDAWQSFKESDDAGRSIVLVRTERGREILRGASEAGYAHLRPIAPEAILQAQKNLLARRRDLFGRLLAMRLLRIPTPRFTGFSLFRGWLELSLQAKVRSVLGMALRIAQRDLWCRERR